MKPRPTTLEVITLTIITPINGSDSYIYSYILFKPFTVET
jgi:hypothetical protein